MFLEKVNSSDVFGLPGSITFPVKHSFFCRHILSLRKPLRLFKQNIVVCEASPDRELSSIPLGVLSPNFFTWDDLCFSTMAVLAMNSLQARKRSF